jgi:hypothetical protein
MSDSAILGRRIPRLPEVSSSSLAHTFVAATAALGLGALIGLAAYLPLIIVGAALATALLVGAFRSYPFLTLTGFWIFLFLQPLIAALLGEQSGFGRFVILLDKPILFVIATVSLVALVRERPRGWQAIIIGGGGFLFFGLVSDITAGVPIKQSAVGAFLGLKFYLVLAISLAVPWTPSHAHRAIRLIVAAAVIAGVAGIFDFLSGGLLRNIFEISDVKVRLGHMAAGGIFRNVAVLATFMALGFTVLMGSAWRRLRTGDGIRLLIMALAGIFTLRLKAIIGIPAGVLALAASDPRARTRAVVAIVVGVVLIFAAGRVVTGVVNQQVTKYTSSSSTTQPRVRLAEASSEIAADRAPLGAGFGRFGSAPSIWKGSYSPTYYQYGLIGYYGFRPEDVVTFALDTTWPVILGETGVAGLLFYLGGVVMIGVALFRRARAADAASVFAAIGFAVLCVCLLDSIARPTMFDALIMVTIGLVIGPGLRLDSTKDDYHGATR